jgi:hypothetical protein
VARVLALRDHRIEYVMVQPLSDPQNPPPDFQAADFDEHVVQFSTRYAVYVPTGLRAQPDHSPAFGVLPTADGGKVVWALR